MAAHYFQAGHIFQGIRGAYVAVVINEFPETQWLEGISTELLCYWQAGDFEGPPL